ncbi:MAG: NAD-glutamate dehydrogenase [Deltaproteobacteria bacterium]|nr:NAD-glutamate dehydrogenase [Deltaproteobacteria bacterium]
MSALQDNSVYEELQRALWDRSGKAVESLDWLCDHMHPYFFITMREETEALVNLAVGLNCLTRHQRLLLADEPQKLILARLNVPGSVYETLESLRERDIAYAELAHSYDSIPGLDRELEVLRFEFGPRDSEESSGSLAAETRKGVAEALRRLYPAYDHAETDRSLDLLWRNNPAYVRTSPAERVARVLWALQQARRRDGVYLDTEPARGMAQRQESRLVFAVANPPEGNFLAQVLEIFHRLDIGVRRAYCLRVTTEEGPYLLGNFYVGTRAGRPVKRSSELFQTLKAELYNTQVLSTATRTYTEFVRNRVLTGEQASLVNAFIGFCHTNLAHNQWDRFGLEDVMRAFHSHPDIALQLARLFEFRFDPVQRADPERYGRALAETSRTVDAYNTGHRLIDEFRRTIFRTCLSFIRHTLKTNFYVPEKQALAFRLDPAYLTELAPEFTADLPERRPFRVTFFCGRFGAGYHIGFADIARGGCRTVIAKSRDDYATIANTLFREIYVLAHTQHLKNKDIYEGGSKMGIVLDAGGAEGPESLARRLFQVQAGFFNAFFDLFVTDGGTAAHPRVVDYYGEDEPIELGPDENLPDTTIEWLARRSVERGYGLGPGVISSKRVGINHKQYGVTSTGVLTFAEVAMREVGIDVRRDPFSVKLTGGPTGDVAGNALRLLLERCPGASIRLVVDGAGAAFDPEGLDREELGRLLFARDIDGFSPERLHAGGFVLFRHHRRCEGLRDLYRKVGAGPRGPVEEWVSADDFFREYATLVFEVPADLFLPGGGRPETIDAENWREFLAPDGTPSARVIVEGANSFLTPDARRELQQRGVVVIRDASANKCGVIASSYEILANLLLTEREFLEHKDEYVADVLEILEKRAKEEAVLIFRRHRAGEGRVLYTQISEALSAEINGHYERLVAFFRDRPELCGQPLFRKALVAHLPRFLRANPRLRARVKNLPVKVQAAMLAAEIATTTVYHGGWEPDFERELRTYLKKHFGTEEP